MVDRICQYGNCTETETPISVNYKIDERPRFCCGEHAALWLLRREWGFRSPDLEQIEPIVIARTLS